MNREIKFRAWIKQSERMVQEVGVNPFHVTDLDRFHWNHDQVELMQFTGLKDKNGKDIYEGDVLEPTLKRDELYIIEFRSGSFVAKSTTHNSMIKTVSQWGKNRKIIGNIYENHDLLQPAITAP